MEQDPELLVKYDKLNESVKEYITKLGCEASDIDPIGSFPLDNRTYERFMVARDNDLKKATDMLLDCIKWRYEKKPGHIKEDQVSSEPHTTDLKDCRGHIKVLRSLLWVIRQARWTNSVGECSLACQLQQKR